LLDAYARREIDLVIDQFTALAADQTDQVAAALARADVVATAVGAKNLKAVAPLLAAGIERHRRENPWPLDIYLCENIASASQTLKKHTLASLDQAGRDWAATHIGFVGTSVARMVPGPSPRFGDSNPLLVVADSYHQLPYDAAAVRAAVPDIAGLRPVAHFRAEVDRKLFTYNLGHAALAYLGYLKGFSYVHQSFGHKYVKAIFEGALDETSAALLRRYPQDLLAAEHEEVRRDVRVRFGNPLLQDTVLRVGRDPIRKLGSHDRLIGSANLCLSQGIFPQKIALVCGAALCFDHPADPDAVRLQQMLQNEGVPETLRQIAQVDPRTDFGQRIGTAYEEFRQSGRKWA
jgi:mannitol-1-phosphate 5-dehydrogenase